MKNIFSRKTKGFTLVEMTVSLGLFTITMFIATSAFLAVVNADRKSRSARIAMDNLNISMEDMNRRMKTGYAYYCDIWGGYTNGDVRDCSPGTEITFISQASTTVSYARGVGVAGCGTGYGTTQGCLVRSEVIPPASRVNTTITSPEIDIKNFSLYVTGSAVCGSLANCASPGNAIQPMAVVMIKGELGINTPNQVGKTSFSLQTTVTQRAYDN